MKISDVDAQAMQWIEREDELVRELNTEPERWLGEVPRGWLYPKMTESQWWLLSHKFKDLGYTMQCNPRRHVNRFRLTRALCYLRGDMDALSPEVRELIWRVICWDFKVSHAEGGWTPHAKGYTHRTPGAADRRMITEMEQRIDQILSDTRL